MTLRAFEKVGVETQVIDIAEDHDARNYVMSLGYSTTPVVVLPSGEHWSGMRPDRIRAVAA